MGISATCAVLNQTSTIRTIHAAVTTACQSAQIVEKQKKNVPVNGNLVSYIVGVYRL